MKRKAKKEQVVIEKGVRALRARKYSLRLYVAGMTPRSSRAIANITKICKEHLKGRYRLEVVDLYRKPIPKEDDQVIVAPTLIKKMPLPLKRLIGDMTNTDKILLALDLRT